VVVKSHIENDDDEGEEDDDDLAITFLLERRSIRDCRLLSVATIFFASDDENFVIIGGDFFEGSVKRRFESVVPFLGGGDGDKTEALTGIDPSVKDEDGTIPSGRST
jgi:hypothetical protein